MILISFVESAKKKQWNTVYLDVTTAPDTAAECWIVLQKGVDKVFSGDS